MASSAQNAHSDLSISELKYQTMGVDAAASRPASVESVAPTHTIPVQHRTIPP